jgi:amidase
MAMDRTVALLPATQAVAQVHAGQLSTRELIEASLAQIEALDPKLHAFITVRGDEVRREAREMDERHARGERLPLHGLPLAVKDNIDTAGTRTTYGSEEYKDNVPVRDVGFVDKLKKAGALVIGKASTPAFAAYMNTRNIFSGTTLNPWRPENSSGGSSGGTAVALATGMAALGIGTDYGGSVRLPAGFNGIVGLRGTPGLIPSFPTFWPFDTFAVAGPMCRTMADLDLMLKHMSGPDPNSPLTPMPAYAGAETVDTRKLRIAWSEDLSGMFPVNQDIRDILRRGRSAVEGVGISVADADPPMKGIRDSIIPLRDLRTLIIHADRLDRTESLNNPLLAASIERAKRTTALDVARAEIARSKVWKACIDFFEKHDVLALPATQMAGFGADQAAPSEIEGVKLAEALDTCLSTYAITMLGWPALVMPCGMTAEGEPVGIQLVAPLGKEDRLIGLGLLLEKELNWKYQAPAMARAAASA